MSLFEKLFGQHPSDKPPTPGFEHFGGEPVDPRNSRYWRSIPHPSRIVLPSMADSVLETVSRTWAHKAGIDDATGPFQDPWIDAETKAAAVAVEEQYLDQIRTEQGLWADEDALAYQQQLQAEILKNQLDIADADYRAGKDALLGEPGATPAWDATVTHRRHVPFLPVPGVPVPYPGPAKPAATGQTSGTAGSNGPVPEMFHLDSVSSDNTNPKTVDKLDDEAA